MGRPLAVQRLDGPAVRELLNGGAAGVHHGFDCKGHAAEQPGSPAGVAVVGDLRCLMHRLAHAVTDVFPDDGVPVAFHILLNGCGDIHQPVALLRVADPLEKALPGHIDQVLGFRRDVSAGEGSRTVSVKSSDIGSHIHADDVALLQHPFARDTVDDLIVDADAGAGRIAVIVEEGRDRALLADKVFHRTVDLLGCYAGPYHFPC